MLLISQFFKKQKKKERERRIKWGESLKTQKGE